MRQKKYNKQKKNRFIFIKKIVKLDEKVGGFFQNSAVGQIFIAILLAAAVALATSFWNNFTNNRRYVERINDLRIGLNQDYVDSMLGNPMYKFSYNEFDIVESIYSSKYAIIRCYYNNERLVAFFVTGRSDKQKILGTDPMISIMAGGKALGEFSFYDVDYRPTKTYGYAMNGVGYTGYYEEYYFASKGLYHMYYYALLDYGFSNYKAVSNDEYLKDDELSRETDICVDAFMGIDRNKSYPNTYGVCEMNFSNVIPDLMVDYEKYDFTSYYNCDWTEK